MFSSVGNRGKRILWSFLWPFLKTMVPLLTLDIRGRLIIKTHKLEKPPNAGTFIGFKNQLVYVISLA